MTLEQFLDEWNRQANEYGASLSRDQRDIAEQAWILATEQEREAIIALCAELGNDENTDDYRKAARWMIDRIRARGTP